MAELVAAIIAAMVIMSVNLVESKFMVYNTSAKIVPGKLNVHLVPHTHDDAGWLKTVDQYYVGSNNSIQGACVQNVLDSLIPALLADKNRKFVYVEQAFFERWWRDQSEAMQHIVSDLVKSGQLEFINGGMVMHDEAATHYIDMIDQTTLGHRFLKKEFGLTPRIGWQIDPFGHSAVQAYLLGAEVGFDSLFFARIDYQDREKRMADKSLEVVWQGSKSLGASAEIFTGAFWQGNYEPPDGFHFEVNDDSPIVQDDPTLFDYNVQDRVNAFVDAALAQANVTRTNHVMWTMGTDFKYQYAYSWFRQMDKLIHYVNLDGRVNALYSTASIYTDAKHATQEIWPTKTDDFFPYADRINGYWTGYFTSRPTLKRYVREMSAYYMAARQLEYLIGRRKLGPNTDALADALAIAQHHDAVTGTEKQHVANDYAKRLSIGYQEAEALVALSIGCLTESSPSTSCQKPTTKFQQCPLLNISYCPASETDLSHGKNLVIVVYNPLGWKREDIIRIPVKSESFVVRDYEGREIVSQVLPISDVQLSLSKFFVTSYLGVTVRDAPNYWLAFRASVPPLGFSTYTVSGVKGSKLTRSSVDTHQGNKKFTFDIGSEILKVQLSENGKLIYDNKKRKLGKKSVEVSYGFYAGYEYNETEKYPQASGAYVFRPNGTFMMLSKGKVQSTVVRGPLINEVHQQINSWIYQVTRAYKDNEYIEVEYTVGPIPVEDGIGKEVVAKLSTDIQSNKKFYTDSNGRDFIERIRDYRSDWDLQVNQPVAGNYYPINLGIYLQDGMSEFSVLVDRSVAGSSILDGQIELMLHRRLLKDDGRGVAEALNETVCALEKCIGLVAQGKFYIKIDHLGEGAKWRRSFGQQIYSPLLLAFSEQDEDTGLNTRIPMFSGMDSSYSLPENVAMITLQELDDGKVLLRLAHLFEVGEDKDLSGTAKVELKKLFSSKKIEKIMETNLSANQERAEMEKKRLVWKSQSSSAKASKVTRGGPIDPTDLIVELAPMEIRTMLIEFSQKSDRIFDI
ncbi:probable alpha-mannosidase At5g13980 isoform X1 [Amaranthus tricolor]|uniref:probable alpha-mannosidase At5g13980 isoform X1 n=2 Tax=Amaranthus tricolor TaxID=29722 RepID=UPI0025885773|nr:probable alpha-mannosidase At5g13980 isoform X1 [Amaranthus tricolor]